MSISPGGDHGIGWGPADQLGTLAFPIPPFPPVPKLGDGLRSPSFDLCPSVALKNLTVAVLSRPKPQTFAHHVASGKLLLRDSLHLSCGLPTW